MASCQCCLPKILIFTKELQNLIWILFINCNKCFNTICFFLENKTGKSVNSQFQEMEVNEIPITKTVDGDGYERLQHGDDGFEQLGTMNPPRKSHVSDGYLNPIAAESFPVCSDEQNECNSVTRNVSVAAGKSPITHYDECMNKGAEPCVDHNLMTGHQPRQTTTNRYSTDWPWSILLYTAAMIQAHPKFPISTHSPPYSNAHLTPHMTIHLCSSHDP